MTFSSLTPRKHQRDNVVHIKEQTLLEIIVEYASALHFISIGERPGILLYFFFQITGTVYAK